MPVSDDVRKEALRLEVVRYLGKGYRLQAQSDFSATLVKPGPPVVARGKRSVLGPFLNITLTVLTLGLWLFVWIPMAFLGGTAKAAGGVLSIGERERSVSLTVDPDGKVQRVNPFLT